MFDMNDFLKLMKKTAVEAVDASKPANIVFGKVINEKPLKIKVDQKLILTEKQLVLSRNVTDHDIDIDIYVSPADETYTADNITWKTEKTVLTCDTDHTHIHEIKGKKKLRILNKLKKDEEVILMQLSGGQKYIVMDRIGKG